MFDDKLADVNGSNTIANCIANLIVSNGNSQLRLSVLA